jgi:hypothetical protein
MISQQEQGENSIQQKGHSAPQPKPKQTVHHEGREEHEVRKLKYNNFRILRVLRAFENTCRDGLKRLLGLRHTRESGYPG